MCSWPARRLTFLCQFTLRGVTRACFGSDDQRGRCPVVVVAPDVDGVIELVFVGAAATLPVLRMAGLAERGEGRSMMERSVGGDTRGGSGRKESAKSASGDDGAGGAVEPRSGRAGLALGACSIR